MLYSDSLNKYDGEIKPQIAKAIQEIESYFKIDIIDIYEWDKFYIVIPVKYDVSLPSRGSVDNLILSTEPVLIKISLANYPESAPMILSNRKNFPKNRLPHLYYRPENEAAALCLVRDNLNQWFATVTISDFLFIGAQWFYKAATGTLLNDNNEFDPTRLSYNFGKHVYKYDTLKDIVINDKRLIEAYPMALLLSSFYDSKLSKNNTFKTIIDIPFIYIDNIKKIISKIYKSKDIDDKFMPLYSILIWDTEQKIEKYYFTNIPSNFKELSDFLMLRGIDIIAWKKRSN